MNSYIDTQLSKVSREVNLYHPFSYFRRDHELDNIGIRLLVYHEKTIEYVCLMRELIGFYNKFTSSVLLKACVGLADLNKGKQVHISVSNSLIDMYCKCGSTLYARRVFDIMFKRDIASWTSLISGYCYLGMIEKALLLFERMRAEGLEPNDFTWNAMIESVVSPAPTVYDVNAVRRVAAKRSFGDENRRTEALAISVEGMIWSGCANGLLIPWHANGNRLQDFQFHPAAVQCLCTFAQGRASLGSLLSWLGSAASDVNTVVVGLQEVDIGAGNLAVSAAKETVGLEGSSVGNWWLDMIDKTLGEGLTLGRIGSRQLAGLLVAVWVRHNLKAHVGDRKWLLYWEILKKKFFHPTMQTS